MIFSQKQMKVLCWWERKSPWENYEAIICDGAVRSGKTTCLCISFIFWAMSKFENQNFVIAGKTIASVRRNILTFLIPALKDMGFAYKEKISQNLMEISYSGKKNKFYFFGGKDEAAASYIQGMTVAGTLFDEVVLMPRSFVEQAMARCSVDGGKFWFNCNPQNPNHWFYKEWILQAENKKALYFHFTMEDNPSLSRAVKSKYHSLYSGVFFERFIEGKWVAAEGLVYPFMTGPFPKAPKKENCEKWAVSCDYGTLNPSSFGLWGLCGDVWYRTDEYYYDARKTGNSRTDEEHYENLRKLCENKKIEWITVDPSAASFIEVIRRHGEFRVVPAKNEVLSGIRRVGVALKEGRIEICDSCKDSIREFGLYRWKNDLSKDAVQKENDHAMDDIRYFVSEIDCGHDFAFTAMAVRR